MDQSDAATTPPNVTQEADIGSGERTPGQRDTDAMIDQIGKAPPPAVPAPAGSAPGGDQTTETLEKKTAPKKN